MAPKTASPLPVESEPRAAGAVSSGGAAGDGTGPAVSEHGGTCETPPATAPDATGTAAGGTPGHLSRLRGSRAYLTLSAVIFCAFVGTGSASPFQTLYATSLGASLSQIALVTGVFSTVALLAALGWGRLSDRLRRRQPFVAAGMAGLALAHLAIAAAATWQWLVPLRVFEGIASGAYQMASLALMGHILEGHPRRGALVSGYRMSGSLAFSVAIVLSGWIAQTAGLRGSYLLASGVYALAFVIALTIPEAKVTRTAAAPSDRQAGEPAVETRTGTPAGNSPLGRAAAAGPGVSSGSAPDGRAVTVRATPPGFGELLRGPFRPLLVLAFSFGLPFSAVYSIWPIWIANELGFGRATYSQLWGLAAFVEVPCMLLCGFLVDRVGRRGTFMLGLGAFGLVYLAYVAAPPLPGLVAAQVLRGFAYAAFTATSLTMAIELAPPAARGRAAGLYSTATSLAQISGNWVGAPLAAAFGFRTVYALAALAMVGAAAYTRVSLRHESS